jgi:hypothetical protein
MSKLNFSQVFTIIVGLITTIVSFFMIGKIIFGMNVSVLEFNLVCILTLINMVNVFHTTK